jgi:signal transduction histidine kinase
MDVYRGNLALGQNHLDAWRKSMGRELAPTNLSAEELFRKLIQSGISDSAVILDPAGHVIYPASEYPADSNPGGQLVQSEVRSLLQNGKKDEAVARLLDPAQRLGFAELKDAEGRLTLPNIELMVLESADKDASNNIAPIREDLEKELTDYANNMPAPQRRFLMRRLAELYPRQEQFPTLPAEELAARYLEAGSEPPSKQQLVTTALPNVWQLASADGRALLLFKSEDLPARLRAGAALPTLPASVNLNVLAPGQKSTNSLLAIPAGDGFPGWQLALTLKDGHFLDAAAQAQTASYIWIATLTMAAVAVLALLGAGLIRRQAAVARLRSDLLANVTHELKTPLASMRLLVDTLLQAKPIHEETARQYLQLIAAENLRLSRLIDNFLTFSRIERNKHAFDFAAVPAAGIVERAANAVRERFAAAGCQFASQAEPALPPVLADADAMVTVLLNLLDNAWKYSGDDKQISLSARRENGNVVFAVKDNGIGLSPRETKRIFKRFYQVDQRLARTGGGCGLGLSIVQYIVTAHHGTVRVESEPGRGSTFMVTLPAGTTSESEAKP